MLQAPYLGGISGPKPASLAVLPSLLLLTAEPRRVPGCPPA